MHRNSRILSRGICVAMAVMLGFSEKEPSGERTQERQKSSIVQLYPDVFSRIFIFRLYLGGPPPPPYANRRKST